ncbi:hypothetical protein BDA99DRAFT_541353 [Phascolomyces articulosus]|uniref:Uncharacterized protein n=1 Tax=Phascolomyces articulosus TaxID=60185 RepID=A0AAD5P9W9_9FUNG|nr:hypothetical protein BDA99DRAFT_541353 [Phascolomyces articulosus]
MADLNWCTFCDNAISAYSDSLYCGEQCLRADALNRNPLLGYNYQEFVDFPRPYPSSQQQHHQKRPSCTSSASSPSLSPTLTATTMSTSSCASSLRSSTVELPTPPKLDLNRTSCHEQLPSNLKTLHCQHHWAMPSTNNNNSNNNNNHTNSIFPLHHR